MSNHQVTEQKIDIAYYIDYMWKACKKLWWVIPLFAAVGCWIGFLGVTRSYQPIYTAQATFTVNVNNGQNGTYYNNTTATKMAKTFPYILTSGSLMNIVSDELGVESVSSAITAEAMEESNLFTIKVTDSDPEFAYQVLQTLIKEYPKVAEYVIGDTMLNILSDDGVPEEPANPMDYRTPALKYGVYGTLLALLLIALYAFTQQTIRTTEDMQKVTSISNLGMVPQIQFKRHNKQVDNSILIRNPLLNSQFSEIMQTIRIRVEKSLANVNGQIVMVTSSIPSEGKSTMASNLADSLAHNDKRVILIDCDLHNPSLDKLWKLEKNEEGLEHVIQSIGPMKKELSKALVKIPGRNLWILPCGMQKVNNASELFVEERFVRCIELLKETVDYIVFDTPPCTVVSDAATLAQYADVAVYVVKHDYARRNVISEGISLIEDSGITFAGYIMNGITSSLSGNSYGYNSGYYGKYGYRRYGYGKSYYGSKDGRYGGYGGGESREK